MHGQEQPTFNTSSGSALIQPVAQQNLAPILKAVGDVMRLEILHLMRRDAFGVLELSEIFDVQQPTMSHHLKVLSKAGLLQSRREGNSIFYRRNQAAGELQTALDKVYELVDMQPLGAATIEGLRAVQQARRLRSKTFFQQNVHRFQEQQDLIASFQDYGAVIERFLLEHAEGHWLEVGSGDGELVARNWHRFSKVTALDNSPTMLKRSQQRLGGQQYADGADGSVQFLLGETSDLIERGLKVDTITCNMVLHHVDSPIRVVEEMSQLLAEGGQLFICDLDQHEQIWAQDVCGDLWLGFAFDDLTKWALGAGLCAGRSEFLALKNGFTVHIREFVKA